MAINALGFNQVYGITNGIQPVMRLPLITALRAPTSLDVAEQGQVWIYDENVWMFVGGGIWSEIAASSSSGTFTQLTVNGNSFFNGGIDAVTDNNTITLDSGTAATNIGTDAAAKTITVGNITGATAVNINSGTGGITLNSNSTGNILLTANDVIGVSYTFTQNARVGSQSIVVPSSIAVNAIISIVMTNSYITGLDIPLLCTVTCNDAGGGLMQVQGMVLGSDTLTISVKNVGSASISSAISNIIVSYMILA